MTNHVATTRHLFSSTLAVDAEKYRGDRGGQGGGAVAARLDLLGCLPVAAVAALLRLLSNAHILLPSYLALCSSCLKSPSGSLNNVT